MFVRHGGLAIPIPALLAGRVIRGVGRPGDGAAPPDPARIPAFLRRVARAQALPLDILAGRVIRGAVRPGDGGAAPALLPAFLRRFARAQDAPPMARAGRVIRRGFAPPPAWLEYAQSRTGLYRIAGAAQYELYVGEDANPDFTAAPAATSPTLPFSHTITPPGSGTTDFHATVRQRNEYGLISLNQYPASFEIDAAGNLVTVPPTSPEDVELTELEGLTLEVRATYYADRDPNEADTWLIYHRADGTDPNPAVDTPETETMTGAMAAERLCHVLGPYAASADVRVLVRVRRSSDSANDGNTTVHQHTMAPALTAPTHDRAFGGTQNEYRV